MSNEDRNAILAQFQSIANTDDVQTSTYYLEASKWDINLAISRFFENSDEVIKTDSPIQSSK